MSRLKMPSKGQSAAMMAELQAEHADHAPADELQETDVATDQASEPDQKAAISEAGAIPGASREERLAYALERANQDELAVVTVRVPASLNRYMDSFVARANRIYPDYKYRKQDAAAEAFAAFYADHPMPPPLPDDQLE